MPAADHSDRPAQDFGFLRGQVGHTIRVANTRSSHDEMIPQSPRLRLLADDEPAVLFRCARAIKDRAARPVTAGRPYVGLSRPSRGGCRAPPVGRNAPSRSHSPRGVVARPDRTQKIKAPVRVRTGGLLLDLSSHRPIGHSMARQTPTFQGGTSNGTPTRLALVRGKLRSNITAWVAPPAQGAYRCAHGLPGHPWAAEASCATTCPPTSI